MFVAHPHEKTGTHFCACHKSVLDKTSFSEGSDEGPNKRKTEMASAESQAAQNAAPPVFLLALRGRSTAKPPVTGNCLGPFHGFFMCRHFTRHGNQRLPSTQPAALK
jgi:hypothetical protein